MQVQVFWVVMLSSKITDFHHFEELYCLHLNYQRDLEEELFIT